MQPLNRFNVGPHSDNPEISVGGTIAVSLRRNLHVGLPGLAQAISVPPDFEEM